MIPDTILRKEDCELVRTPEEFIAWIESVDEQFRTDDRIGEELIKKFLEEIRPLGDLARHKYLGRPCLSLRPRVGYQNYDAEIIDTSSGNERITRVEFTSGYRDKYLALREEYLDQHGDVYGTGYVGRTETGQVEVIPEFVDHQTRLNTMLDTIKARVTDKLGKSYEANTILTIVFDDTILYESDLPQLQPCFHDIMLSQQVLSKFCGVYILGASGKTLWEFGESVAAHLTR